MPSKDRRKLEAAPPVTRRRFIRIAGAVPAAAFLFGGAPWWDSSAGPGSNRPAAAPGPGLSAGQGALPFNAPGSNLSGIQGSKEKPLNIVFILVDDLGWRDLGCYGGAFYETPNCDRLAREGMRFTQAYAACPVCSPTRASIMAGKYPARMGTTDYFGAGSRARPRRGETMDPAPYRDRLPLKETTVAEAFKATGYRTFFAGKWHLGPEGFWPEDQGFDVNKGGWTRGGPYGGHKYFSPYGNPRLEDGPPGEHLPDRLARETCRFIEAEKDNPFLAFLCFYSVHTPLMARADLKEKYEKKKKDLDLEDAFGREGKSRVRLVQDHAVYGGMVEAMDLAVGKVLDTLDRLELAERTAVILMSDNGGLSTSEGLPTSNLPLRAGKGWIYEGGIREPMIVRWPGKTRPGSVCDEPVISTDFYPTMLEMAGLPPKPRQHVDGKSFVPLLEGRPMKRGPLFWHYPHYGNQGGSPAGAIRDGDFKLIEWFGTDGSRLELYNLREDIGELHNLAKEKPEKTKELYAKLKAWQKNVGARFPTPAKTAPAKTTPAENAAGKAAGRAAPPATREKK